MKQRQPTVADQSTTQPEAALLYAVQREFGRGKNYRLNRQNTGVAKYCSECERVHRLDKHPAYRVVRYGMPGQPDLQGVIAPLGRILALETKSSGGHLSEEQVAYHAMITKYGGLVKVVRSIEEARQWMKEVGAEW